MLSRFIQFSYSTETLGTLKSSSYSAFVHFSSLRAMRVCILHADFTLFWRHLIDQTLRRGCSILSARVKDERVRTITTAAATITI